MRSRYTVMTASETEKDTDDKFWPDSLTFPITKLKLTDNSYSIDISKKDVQRIDSLMYDMYRVAELDDIVLWFNNIAYLPEIELGIELDFPTKGTIDSFLLNNRSGKEEL